MGGSTFWVCLISLTWPQIFEFTDFGHNTGQYQHKMPISADFGLIFVKFGDYGTNIGWKNMIMCLNLRISSFKKNIVKTFFDNLPRLNEHVLMSGLRTGVLLSERFYKQANKVLIISAYIFAVLLCF